VAVPGYYTDTSVGAPAGVNDSTLQAEVARAVQVNGWSRTFDAQFVVIPAPGSNYQSGFDTGFCGYHGVDGAGSSYTFDAYIGDAPFAQGCAGYDANRNVNNVTSMIAAHEYAESVTDPHVDTWLTSDGYEIGDICASGDDLLPSGAYAQGLWDNRQNACSLSDAGPPAWQLDLAANGGFESGWGPWAALPGTSTNYVDYQSGQVAGESARSGSHYGATNTSTTGGGIYQDVPLSAAPGQVVCASAWVRTQAPATGGNGSFVVWLLGGSYNENGVASFTGLSNGANWRQVQTCVSASTGHSALRIQLYPQPNGPTVDIDDVDVH
jgi:hypothetical protein